MKTRPSVTALPFGWDIDPNKDTKNADVQVWIEVMRRLGLASSHTI